jgi:putative pantetheine hydrolase
VSRPGATNGIVDVAGVLIGSYERTDSPFLTGTTVLLFPDGAVLSVEVRGGAPGTRETDLLDPRSLVESVNALVLTGGSAYGLDAAGGVMRFLEEHDTGFRVGQERGEVVPIVPAAVLFDLGRGGDFRARPDADFGYRAAAAAANAPVAQGNHGAGTGARAGSFKGGIGTASEELVIGLRVGAIVAVNSSGEAVDPTCGIPYGTAALLQGEIPHLRPPIEQEIAQARERPAGNASPLENTTIGVVATDAVLTKVETQKLAGVAHDGLARAIQPAHGYFDGDTVFAASTRRMDLAAVDRSVLSLERRLDRAELLDLVFAAATRAFTRAVVHALLAAESVNGLSSYRELYPSAVSPHP